MESAFGRKGQVTTPKALGGHPPFGHLAETALHRLASATYRLQGGFEGNAQSFRIVANLAVGDGIRESSGGFESVHRLNLNRATLNAILMYTWLHQGNPAKPDKWAA